MLNLLLIFFALATVAAAVMKFLDDVGLRDTQKLSLKTRFDEWWRTVSEMDRGALALVLAAKLSDVVDRFLGARLLSRHAFWRSFVVSTWLLVLFLGLTGIHNGRTIGVAPWVAYKETFSQLDQIWSKAQKPPATEDERKQQEGTRNLKKLLMPYNSTGWTITYSVFSLAVLEILNSLLFFFSVVYSRMILREIIAAGRVFSTITLLLANFALVFPIWTVVFLLVTVLFTPWLWLLIPIVFLLSTVSVYWLIALIGAGSIASLAFGSAALKVITLVGFLPCLFAVIVTVLSGIVLIKRIFFHRVVSSFLQVCIEKGPTKVAAAVLTLIAAVFAAAVLIIRYWK